MLILYHLVDLELLLVVDNDTFFVDLKDLNVLLIFGLNHLVVLLLILRVEKSVLLQSNQK